MSLLACVIWTVGEVGRGAFDSSWWGHGLDETVLCTTVSTLSNHSYKFKLNHKFPQ